MLELTEENHTQREIAEIMTNEFEVNYTRNMIKNKLARTSKRAVSCDPKQTELTINQDGSQTSRTTVQMNAEQAKDVAFVLKAHGFNPSEWELVSAKNNFWQQNSQEGGLIDLYQSKITVKPKTVGFSLEKAIDLINAKVKPKEPVTNKQEGNTYLSIPLFDLHFGNNTKEDYEESQDKTINIIRKGHKEIAIILGGDLLHNDNHRGTTSSGTVIDKVDMTKAWDDAFDYVSQLIDESLVNAATVKVVYVPGNHDEITGQTIVKAMERVYSKESRLSIDSSHQMFKAFLLGANFIGATHGDRSTWKKYQAIFSAMFSELWGTKGVVTREVFSGHLHFEAYKDMDGLMLRQAPTMNKIDEYHLQNGYMTAHKRFEVVEYDSHRPNAVYYV